MKTILLYNRNQEIFNSFSTKNHILHGDFLIVFDNILCKPQDICTSLYLRMKRSFSELTESKHFIKILITNRKYLSFNIT